jgi:hypothetical protein
VLFDADVVFVLAYLRGIILQAGLLLVGILTATARSLSENFSAEAAITERHDDNAWHL